MQAAKFTLAPTIRPALAEEIMKERKAQNLSQRALARKANISQGTITRAETRLQVSLGTLERIVEALGKKLSLT